MRVGVVVLPEHRWPAARALWRRVEELGFDHAWTYDHLAWRNLRDGPWFGAVPTLTAAALVTERIRLGTLVASPTFRHPVPFAKELMTLDDVSGGRFTLGIGAGSRDGWDATMLGPAWSPAERAGRFAEFVALLDRLLREPETSYEGEYYSADGARSYPGCVQEPRLPFAIAAAGPRGMALAATFGQTWVTIGDLRHGDTIAPPEGAAIVKAQVGRLEDACAAAGRDPATLDRLVLTGGPLASGLGSVEEFRDTCGRYADAGVTDLVVHRPRDGDPYEGDVATFEAIMAACLPFA